MKKLNYFFLLLFLVILIGCRQESEPKIDKKKIDTKTIQKVVGEWKDDSYDYDNYIITSDNRIIDFNSTILIIDFTEDNRIYSHEKNDEKFHYDFVIEKNSLIVHRSYEIEQSSNEPLVGGSLAPLTLMKEVKMSRTNILGDWKPLENDSIKSIRIETSFDFSRYNIIITKNDGSTKIELLSLISERKNAEFHFTNENSTMNYLFSNYDNSKLTITPINIENDTEVPEKAWNLKRISG